jgi:hypothetical protein
LTLLLGRAIIALPLCCGKGSHRFPARSQHRPREAAVQLSLLGTSDAFLEELASLDVDSLTPLQAITKLYELREKARGKQG